MYVCVCLSVCDIESASKVFFGFAWNSVFAFFTQGCYASLNYVKFDPAIFYWRASSLYLDFPYFLTYIDDMLHKIYPRKAIEAAYVSWKLVQ